MRRFIAPDALARSEDEAICCALALHDIGLTFAEIGAQLCRDPAWAREVCTCVFLEDAAGAPRN